MTYGAATTDWNFERRQAESAMDITRPWEQFNRTTTAIIITHQQQQPISHSPLIDA